MIAVGRLHQIPATIEGAVARIESIPHDVSQLALMEHLSEVIPAADLVLGGGMLVLIMLVHATGVRAVTNYVVRRSKVLLARPSRWRVDVLMSLTVFMLLGLHLLEIFGWAATLVYAGLVPDWHAAGFFAGSTYTTLGYGAFILPDGWKMLAPIMAISGLFAFGWSVSVLVDLMARCQSIKVAASQE